MDAARRAVAARYPGRSVVLTNSGTAALTLAFAASRRASGSPLRVALPAYACPDIGTAVIGAGGELVLYDVDPTTLAPDLTSVRQSLQLGTTHLLAVHLLGRLVDVTALAAVAAETGAVLVEDAAQHAGATWHGVRGGALADWSILSFGRGKGLNAGGGGALLYRAANDQVADRANQLEASLASPSRLDAVRTLIMAAVAEWCSHPAVYAVPASIPALGLGDTVYHPPSPLGAMHTTAAALLVEALEREPEELRIRRAADAWFRAALGDRSPMMLAPPPTGMVTGALRFPVHLPAGDVLTWKRHGVWRSYPRTLAEYPELQPHIANPEAPLPGARALAATLHTLPTHSRVTTADRERLVTLLRGLSR
jgi:dTDP-4-amino-4,6-dideoxygalactose transaminase